MATYEDAPQQLVLGVTLLHLAREIVHADQEATRCMREAMWDRIEIWHLYRERAVTWRFHTLRGNQPDDLHRCPFCGRVQESDGDRIVCWDCRRAYQPVIP